MPRPRTVTDDAILDAAEKAIAASGPVRFTLAEVGRSVGLSGAAILRRFESKRALLLAVAKRGRAKTAGRFDAAARAKGKRLDALVAALSAGWFSSRAEVGGSLEFLALDLRDPDFGQEARAILLATEASARSLLDAAARGLELKPATDLDALARAVVVAQQGAVLRWAIRGDAGAAEGAIAASVEAALAPHRLPTR